MARSWWQIAAIHCSDTLMLSCQCQWSPFVSYPDGVEGFSSSRRPIPEISIFMLLTDSYVARVGFWHRNTVAKSTVIGHVRQTPETRKLHLQHDATAEQPLCHQMTSSSLIRQGFLAKLLDGIFGPIGKPLR